MNNLLTTSSFVTAISTILTPITAARGEDTLTIAASESSTLAGNCTKYNK